MRVGTGDPNQDLTGAAAFIYVADEDLNFVFSAEATIASSDTVTYTIQAGQIPEAGTYWAQLGITLADGTPLVLPVEGFRILVAERLPVSA